MKNIYFTDPAGYTYAVDAEPIARSRAEYYAKLDAERGLGEYQEVYDREYKYTMSSEGELVDWLKAEYTWEEVKPMATVIDYDEPETEDDWFYETEMTVR